MRNITETIDNNFCSGCGMCNSVCSKNAIQLQYDNIGNLLPVIDQSQCVDCGLCQTVCPGSSKSKLHLSKFHNPFIGNIRNAYIGRSLDPIIYQNSQSGGIVTALLTYLFHNKQIDAAIVCRCSYGNRYPTTESIVVTSACDLFNSQKSIYTPVDVLSRLKDVQSFEKVAIVALPCQMEALELAQSKGLFKNVKYRLGLVCDRILSRMIYQSLLPIEWRDKEFQHVMKGKAYRLSEREYKAIFRDKKYNNYKIASMVYMDKKNGVIVPLSPYPRHHLKDFYTHPRCWICFDKINVFADISCGDPWGMDGVDWEKGDSLILSRSEVGDNLLCSASHDNAIQLNKCDIDTVVFKQDIEGRIRRCSAGIEIYKKNSWQIPSYYEDLGAFHKSQAQYRWEEKMIKMFLKNKKMSKEDILKEAYAFRKWNSKRMTRVQRFNSLRNIVKKIKDIIIDRVK